VHRQFVRPSEREVVPALLDIDAAAVYLATTTRHLRRLVQERRVGFVKLGGKLRFRPEDLDGIIAAGAVEGRAR